MLKHHYTDGVTADGVMCGDDHFKKKKNSSQELGWKSQTEEVCEGQANDSLPQNTAA